MDTFEWLIAALTALALLFVCAVLAPLTVVPIRTATWCPATASALDTQDWLEQQRRLHARPRKRPALCVELFCVLPASTSLD